MKCYVAWVLDRVLFSELTPWVMLGLAFLLPACISLPFIRSVKPLRKLLWGGCVFAVMIAGAIGYLPYVYVGSGSTKVPRSPTPFAVTDETGFIVVSQGHMAKLGWNAEVLWRLRL